MKLKKYDLILIKNTKTLFGIAVKFLLKSEYSHVAIYIGNYHVIDTDLRRAVSVHEINDALGDFDVYRYKGILSIQQEQIMDEFLMKAINAKYDVLEAVSTWLKLNIGLEKRYICISLATEAFIKAGINIDNSKNGFDKIIQSPDFKKITK